MQWANRYKDMANDELKHAEYLHDKAIQKIEEISKVYKPTEEMEEKWENRLDKADAYIIGVII